jgi:hypothetical protein
MADPLLTVVRISATTGRQVQEIFAGAEIHANESF